ncbi:hypothetical protein [Jiangella asiatica]|uniref:Uncharacterized protein n=1 Tax=Jiangella asiatica TaxID=2530372 RepID=A0A4R5CV16_9ACTN|nr:hypothetical protein [Jiangella asiatica]TDE02831.1 hypothetical protein E1269_21305 [Jiangella asiatica]
MTTREVEWDDAEQDWMRALSQYRATLCPLCGRPIEVCTDPANEMRWRSGLPTRCHATTAVLQAQEGLGKKKKQSRHTGALLWSAELNTS